MLYALIAIMGLGVVDSYFISYLGTVELAAIGFIVPITQIVTSFGLGLGMAVSSLVSKLIGANKTSDAASVVTNGVYLTFGLSLITIIALIWQLKPIFMLVGADAQTMPAIMSYMHIWVLAVPAVIFTMVCSSTFRALGDTKTSASIAIIMTVSNMLLNPVFIFGFGPIPELGIAGAAVATLISVIFACIIGGYQLIIRERLIELHLPSWTKFTSNVQSLLEIAIPAVLANSVVPIIAATLTAIVAALGTDAVAGFGVGSRIEAMMLIVVYALSSTLPMFIGQNLGAQKKERVKEAIKIAFRFTLIFQLILYVVLALLAAPIAAQFSDEESVQQTIILYLRIVPLAYGLSGIIILVNVSMNVLGKPKIALYINILRLVLLYAPFAYIGSKLNGIIGFFVGITIAHFFAYLMATLWFNKTLKEIDI